MRHLFFDLDGTLTDPKQGIVSSLRHVLAQLQVSEQHADYDWCIGPPLHESLKLIVGPDLLDDAVRIYRQRYSDVGLYENELYSGIPDLLASLKDDGFVLHVATSKVHVYAKRILDHFELSQYFDTVFGSELDGTRSNKAELLTYALSKTGADVDESVMIGDRKFDMLGAKANAMRGIGVLWGYGDKSELLEAGADDIACDISGLHGYLS